MRSFSNKTIPGFLDADQLALIEHITDQYGSKNVVGSADNDSLHHALISSFFLDWPGFEPIRQIIVPRIRHEFGSDIELDFSTHILEAYSPYGIHSDVMTSGSDTTGKRLAAWTFIIPLDDYDSHTIVFHQGFADIKTPQEAIDQGWLQPHGQSIDLDFHKNYISHCNPSHLSYLTVEEIFPWRKGTLFATDRRKFHVSDNFPQRGLKCKRAIIMWSSVPLNSQKE